MLKIAVFDDEKYYLGKVTGLLKKELEKRDINMPGVNGMKAAERMREIRPGIILGFITAFVDYAVEGYKTGAILLTWIEALSCRIFCEIFWKKGIVWKGGFII